MNTYVKGLALFTITMVIAVAMMGQINKNQPQAKSISQPTVDFKQVTSFPKAVDPQCRDGKANTYDECGDQRLVLAAALEAAQQNEKHVLMVYGAEWCIWCHVFDQYVKGGHKQFTYQWQYHDGDDLFWLMQEREGQSIIEQAVALNHFVAENFVLAHIESYYSNGDEVMVDLGYDVDTIQYVPLIISLDTKGQLASQMKHKDQIKGLEVRENGGEEFRGYDRMLLLEELKRLKTATQSSVLANPTGANMGQQGES